MLSTRAWRVNCRIHGSMDQLSRLISTPHLWRQGPSLKQATSPNVQNILEDFLEKNHCSNGFKVKLLLHKGGLKCRNQETGGFLGVTSRFVPSSKSKNLTNKTWTCFEDVFHESDFVDTLLIASFCQLTAPSPGRRFQYWTPWVCRNVVSSNSTRCRNDVLFSPILWYVKSATLIHCNPLCCSCYWLAWLGIRPWLLLELCSKSPGKAADASFLGRRH